MIDWDALAHERHGLPFDKLSAFAQAELRTTYYTSITRPEIGPQEIDLVRAVAASNEKVAKLQRENRDLWHENEELKIENLELTDELNKNSSGRGTRNR